MKEIWKGVKFIDKNNKLIDFADSYQVSNFGRVKGVDRLCKGCEQGTLRKVKKKHKESKRSNGYIEVGLYRDNKEYRISVHRLVAYVFIPNPNNKPCVEHINTIRNDNRVCNLRWCTYIENNNNPITKQKQCVSNKLALTPQKRMAISKTLKRHFLTHKNPWAQEIIDVKTNQKFNSIKKAAKSINKDEEWLAGRLRGEVKNNTDFQYAKKYTGIRSIKRKHYKGKVYDLTVEKKHSYNIDGLAVHNSVGGSFIAYLMGITQIDPMQFNLLFHRFISKDRQDLPDIDIDVEKRYRDKVVKYIKDTYGQNNTCGISTCMTMQSKAAIRDVGRVMEIPSKEINQLAGNVWKSVKDLNEFFEKSTEGKAFKGKYPKATKLMIKMEGQCRGAGRHAAAVVISKDDLTKTDKCVLVNRTKQMVCNWTMGDSEYVGLMKLDILGLSTLSVLTEAKELINRKENPRQFYCNPETGHKIVLAEMERELDDRYQGYNEIEFDFNAIPLEEDEKVFNIISEGRTSGLFQLSGYSVTEFCKKMKIHSFNDIIAAISLARPGPFDSGMADEYVDRKHGKKWERKHPIYEEVTKDTYGICVYQEQIMAVISKVAGLDESTADKIRKIIAKKLDTKKLKPFWKMFRGGCKKMKTFSEQEAEAFWEELKQHASYSFNKCVSGDTILKRNSTNHHNCELTVREMYKIKNDIEYARKTNHLPLRSKFLCQGYGYGMSLNDDNRVRKNIIRNIQPAGDRIVFRLTLENGAQIDITDNHKFPTPKGNKKLSDLTTNDYIYFCGSYEKTNTNYNFTKKKQITKGKKYGPKEGFPKGEKNPGYIDGSFIKYEEFKNKTPNICTICGKRETRIETHHIDGDRNNNEFNNLQKLCVSCHKKEHYKNGRTKRGQKGYPAFLVQIKSIKQIGSIDTYDVTMDKPYHNFVTDQNIVTCNSHAGAYAMIGYWTAWLKVHYQKEFYAASLTFNEWNEKSGDSNKRKESLLKEIRMAGYEIMPPKRNGSDAVKWQFNDKKFYTPFIEINGIGENNASKCLIAPKKTRIQGFFSSKHVDGIQNNTKLDKILQEMMVDDVEIPSQKILSKYLPNINLKRNKNERYPNLMNFLGFDFPDSELDNWLTLNVSSKNIPLSFLQRKRFRLEKPIYQCNRCELRQRSGKPILSSTGLNNVVILFEHPEIDSPRQDKIGTNEKGKLIFDELAKHKYKRRFFQTTACCRCPISSSEYPTIEIDKCHYWLSQEVEQIECRLILGIGNRSVYSLTGRNDNIEDLAGTTEWIENLSAWVCWCDEKNLVKSIENFVKILKKVV